MTPRLATERSLTCKTQRLTQPNRTDGRWWGLLTHAPYVGDDAHGLRVLARTLSLVSTDGVAPMAESVDQLDGLTDGRRIDLDLLESLQAPVNRASQVFTEAAANVNRVDTYGLSWAFSISDTRTTPSSSRRQHRVSALPTRPRRCFQP